MTAAKTGPTQELRTTPPSNKRKEWLAGAIVLVITICWCAAAARIIYYTGDQMIGFHPLLLLLLPYAGILALATILGCVMRRWRFALLVGLAVFGLCMLFAQGYRVENWAWSKSIRQYDLVNRQAIEDTSSIPEFTDDSLFENLWADEALPVVDGFQWYCEHHHAAPDAAFRAFRYRGIVHIKIQKIRHGCAGIAFIPSAQAMKDLHGSTQINYKTIAPGESQWLIWRSNFAN